MRVIDLTHPVATGMPVYPGDPEVRIDRALSVSDDGVEVARLELGSHSGTHIDAPSHSIPGGRTVDQLPLDMLVGSALVLRPQVRADAEIRPEHVVLPDRLPGIVCIATGWDRWFSADGFLRGEAQRHPWIALGLAEELWRRGGRVLGVDTLSPDRSASEGEGGQPLQLPVHEFWLGAGGVIVENLTRLDQVPVEPQMSLLPLRLSGVDGSPVRAIAWERAADASA